MHKWAAIRQGKCPKCRVGEIFEYPLARIGKFNRMHETCRICGLRFVVEPGFFIGAMYFNYVAVIAIIVTVGLSLYYIFDDPDLWVYATVVGVVTIALLPLIFRFSRTLFLYWFGGVRYDPRREEKNR